MAGERIIAGAVIVWMNHNLAWAHHPGGHDLQPDDRSLVGFLVPVVLKAMNYDPAVASSIFITTFTDVCGFFIFLGLARCFCHICYSNRPIEKVFPIKQKFS